MSGRFRLWSAAVAVNEALKPDGTTSGPIERIHGKNDRAASSEQHHQHKSQDVPNTSGQRIELQKKRNSNGHKDRCERTKIASTGKHRVTRNPAAVTGAC